MLLNPSHTVTFSGLPPDVLDTYVRYKKGTRAIVKWLSQHAPAETRQAYLDAKTLPINDLAKLARIASKHISCMPDVVHFHFRETIAARSSLSKYFRKQTYGNSIDPSTINHEHFTASLTDIYSSLCECCGQPTDYCRKPIQGMKVTKDPLSNHFTHLSIEDCSCNDDEHESISSVSCESCDTGNTTPSCPSTDPDIRLSGDDLSDAIETIAIIRQIHELYQASEDIWRQAGAGGVSLVVAAAVTNVAFASLRKLETHLRDLDPSVDLPSLHKTCGLPQGLSLVEYEAGPKGEDQHQMLEDMHASWKAVTHIREGHRLPTGVVCIHKPAEFFDSPDLVTLLAQAVLNLVSGEATPDSITRNSTPVYAEIGYLLTHREDTSNSLRSTFSLHMLSATYKAYISSLRSPSMLPSCRLSALKLSQQAEASLSAIIANKIAFPCRCRETIANHLDQLKHVLQNYTARNCWDVFFQAPWVAGNHILEMLDMCFYYGMRLMRYRHYVGSVIHSYNVLRQLAAMEEVPLLEELCNVFASLFFTGGQRPTNRFAASWARFVGARLKFKKGHKSQRSPGGWCMAVPSHAARRAAGFGISSDGKAHITEDAGFSEIIDLKRAEFHLVELRWNTICAWGDVEPKQRGRRRSDDVSHPTTIHNHHLRNLSSYLAQDGKGSLPPLRLNLFAVFETCLKIVCNISNATHTDPNDKEIGCICFATTILTGGDRIRDAEILGRPDCWKKSNGEREVVENAKAAISEIFARVDV